MSKASGKEDATSTTKGESVRPEEDSPMKSMKKRDSIGENEPIQGQDGFVEMDHADSSLKASTEEPVEKDTATTCDRVTNIIALMLLFAVAITSVVAIAAGASTLASLSGQPFSTFPFFFAFGVTPVVVGCVCLIISVFVIVFIAMCAMGLSNYGMCFYGSTRCRAAGRVCLFGIFPFIVFIVLLVLCILGFTIFSLSQQLPPLDTDYTEVDGINGPIYIVRDQNGLTHIKASSRDDAFFGQGFAEAQDRLFQLEFHRIVAQGKLGSLVGANGKAADVAMRTVNVRDAAYSMCNSTDPEILRHMSHFTDGINLFLQRVSKRPVEFFFMGNRPLFFHDPEPFSVVDICLTLRLFMFQMSSNVGDEGSRFSLWAATDRTYSEVMEFGWDFTSPPNTIISQTQMTQSMQKQIEDATEGLTTPQDIQAKVQEVMMDNEKNVQTSAAVEAAIYDNLASILRTQLQAAAGASKSVVSDPHDSVAASVQHVMTKTFRHDPSNTAFAFKYLQASNAWATRDAEGRAMVASDPHLTANMPSVWYYTHLSYPDSGGVPFDAAGVALIGLPGVHIGKTTYMAWGITMSMTDLEDLFIFPPPMMSGLPENTYMYNGGRRIFTERSERVVVKGEKDILLTVQDSVLGPVVSEMLGFPSMLKVAMFATPLRHGDNTSLSMFFTVTDPDLTTADQLMDVLPDLQAPGFSIPIADTQGNLAYSVTGHHPIRSLGHTGLLPTFAFDGPDILCRLMSLQAGLDAPEDTPCDLLQLLGRSTGSAGASSVDLATLLPLLQRWLSNSKWSTYVPATADAPFTSVPAEEVPHVLIPFDGTASHISCANQKVMPQGYPYFLGGDYSWPYRGARIQNLLDANMDNLADLKTHMEIQMDHRSNLWDTQLAAVVKSDAFHNGLKDDSVSEYWWNRMVNWDMNTNLGSVETAFLWRWLQRVSVLPRDANAVRRAAHSRPTQDGYVPRMLTAPTARMTAECASYINDYTTTQPCIDMAVREFKAQANDVGEGYSEKWGEDLSRLGGLHEMMSTQFIYPVWQRIINKAGDGSSVAVNHGSMDGDMLSTQASSVRQIFDLWNNTGLIYMAFPAGNSGNPYSEYYDNLLYKFEKEEYTMVQGNYTLFASLDSSSSQKLTH